MDSENSYSINRTFPYRFWNRVATKVYPNNKISLNKEMSYFLQLFFLLFGNIDHKSLCGWYSVNITKQNFEFSSRMSQAVVPKIIKAHTLSKNCRPWWLKAYLGIFLLHSACLPYRCIFLEVHSCSKHHCFDSRRRNCLGHKPYLCHNFLPLEWGLNHLLELQFLVVSSRCCGVLRLDKRYKWLGPRT